MRGGSVPETCGRFGAVGISGLVGGDDAAVGVPSEDLIVRPGG